MLQPTKFELIDVAPDFEVDTTQGRIRFRDWIGGSWAVLFSHPKDFAPVCTTELGYMARIKPELDKRHKIIGLSIDAMRDHCKWASDISKSQGTLAGPSNSICSDPRTPRSLNGFVNNLAHGSNEAH